MRLAKYLMAAAAVTMSVSPALAATANPASALSVSKSVRVGTAARKSEKAVAGGVIIAVLAAAAVIAGIVIVADSDDSPDSP